MKSKKNFFLFLIYEAICFMNTIFVVNRARKGDYSFFSANQLTLIGENTYFVYGIAIILQLIVSISLLAVEVITLCILTKKIDNIKMKMSQFFRPLVIGNIVLILYNVFFINIIGIESVGMLKVFNLLPFGVLLKVMIVSFFLYLDRRKIFDRTIFIYKNGIIKMTIFFILEYAYSCVGYFSI